MFDDILVLLAWLTGFIEVGPSSNFALGQLGLNVLAFFSISTIVGVFVFPLGGQLIRGIKLKEFEFSAFLVGALAFAVLAEFIGLHFIVGAFIAGLFFGRKTIDESAYSDVRNKTSAMIFGFLAPIFFVSVGLHLDFSAVLVVPAFVAWLLLAAFVGKFIGAGVASRCIGHSRQEAAAVGVGMSAREAVELVIANIALKAGLFEYVQEGASVIEHIYSAVVIMAVLTTLVTPVLLKRIYGGN